VKRKLLFSLKFLNKLLILVCVALFCLGKRGKNEFIVGDILLDREGGGGGGGGLKLGGGGGGLKLGGGGGVGE